MLEYLRNRKTQQPVQKHSGNFKRCLHGKKIPCIPPLFHDNKFYN